MPVIFQKLSFLDEILHELEVLYMNHDSHSAETLYFPSLQTILEQTRGKGTCFGIGPGVHFNSGLGPHKRNHKLAFWTASERNRCRTDTLILFPLEIRHII